MNCRGMDDPDITNLHSQLIARATLSLGSPMLFELIEVRSVFFFFPLLRNTPAMAPSPSLPLPLTSLCAAAVGQRGPH